MWRHHHFDVILVGRHHFFGSGNMGRKSHQAAADSGHIEGIDIPTAVFSDRVSLIQATRKGLSGEVVRQAVEILGYREVFIRLLETTGGNLSRYYRRKALTPSQSECILDTLGLFAMAILLFGDKDKAREWMETDIPALGGQSPLALCDTFAGREMVRGALRKIEFGEFA